VFLSRWLQNRGQKKRPSLRQAEKGSRRDEGRKKPSSILRKKKLRRAGTVTSIQKKKKEDPRDGTRRRVLIFTGDENEMQIRLSLSASGP